MKNPLVFLVVCLLGTVLVACGDSSPTATSAEGSRLDNGSSFGSGHDATSDSTFVAGTTDTTTAVSSMTGVTAAGGLTISRNGSGFGSGH